MKITPSHPTWVCGLKPLLVVPPIYITGSHPTWVCGLKHNIKRKENEDYSHTLRGCVD